MLPKRGEPRHAPTSWGLWVQGKKKKSRSSDLIFGKRYVAEKEYMVTM